MTKTELKKLANEIKCTDHVSYRGFLAALFAAAQISDPNYTYADFSTDLEIGSQNSHLVIHGKRDIGERTGKKIAKILAIVKEQRRYFLASVAHERAKSSEERQKAYQEMVIVKSSLLPNELSRSQLKFFGHWAHSVVLEALRMPNASDDPEWLKKHILPKVSLKQIKDSIALLEELTYVAHCDVRNRLFPSEENIQTGNEAKGMAIYQFHQQMIDLGKMAMNDVSAREREISAITIAVDEGLRSKLKSEIASLRDKYIRLAEKSENPKEVIQVNFQLFPVAKIEEEE